MEYYSLIAEKHFTDDRYDPPQASFMSKKNAFESFMGMGENILDISPDFQDISWPEIL